MDKTITWLLIESIGVSPTLLSSAWPDACEMSSIVPFTIGSRMSSIYIKQVIFCNKNNGKCQQPSVTIFPFTRDQL